MSSRCPTGIITATRSTVTQWNSRETVPNPIAFPPLSAPPPRAATLARNPALPQDRSPAQRPAPADALRRRGRRASAPSLAWALAALPFGTPAACILGFGLYGLVAAVMRRPPRPLPPARRLRPRQHPHPRPRRRRRPLRRPRRRARPPRRPRPPGGRSPAPRCSSPSTASTAGSPAARAVVSRLRRALRHGDRRAPDPRPRRPRRSASARPAPGSSASASCATASSSPAGSLPALARPLPASERRRAVCALQVAVLGLLLAPPLDPPLSAALAAAAFAALVGSFAIDVAWLLRPAR